jgi:hypothetical protein
MARKNKEDQCLPLGYGVLETLGNVFFNKFVEVFQHQKKIARRAPT